MSATPAAVRPAIADRRLHAAFVAAEWIKLRTLRSTTTTLAVAALLSIGLSALACQRMAARLAGLSGVDRMHFLLDNDVISQSLLGNAVAQLAIGTLGVLVICGEFGTGMIRASLGAMPQRQRWILAKIGVFAAVALVVSELLTVVSFFVGQAILNTQHGGASISDPGALRAVIATGLYVALVGLMGLALGLIIRHTAGALATLLGVLFVLPGLLGVLPQSWQPKVSQLLPLNIGEQAANATRLSEHLSTWSGLALMAGYVVVLTAFGCALLQRRDA